MLSTKHSDGNGMRRLAGKNAMPLRSNALQIVPMRGLSADFLGLHAPDFLAQAFFALNVA